MRWPTGCIRRCSTTSGWSEALRVECERASRRGAVPVAFDGDMPARRGARRPLRCACSAWRRKRCAMRCATRRPQRIRVELRVDGGGAELRVVDDGSGFDPQADRARASLGLASMRERVALLGGRLEIRSRPGEGTSVTAWVPRGGDAMTRPRVLLADDHRIVLAGLEALLRDDYELVGRAPGRPLAAGDGAQHHGRLHRRRHLDAGAERHRRAAGDAPRGPGRAGDLPDDAHRAGLRAARARSRRRRLRAQARRAAGAAAGAARGGRGRHLRQRRDRRRGASARPAHARSATRPRA